ncbi:hypothetical protein PoB_003293600 [Plakobranchus ocellatus]|uniref:Uncharacterized protein n=1 Tax=Plakobranchus ocellatus TaxID=259542 RepID=A0AAV4A5C4_9GAST|nr:hypothetical protein PoB_003293600 [Plakobranchus ocellatus]
MNGNLRRGNYDGTRRMIKQFRCQQRVQGMLIFHLAAPGLDSLSLAAGGVESRTYQTIRWPQSILLSSIILKISLLYLLLLNFQLSGSAPDKQGKAPQTTNQHQSCASGSRSDFSH